MGPCEIRHAFRKGLSASAWSVISTNISPSIMMHNVLSAMVCWTLLLIRGCPGWELHGLVQWLCCPRARALQRVIRSTQRVAKTVLPAIQHLYSQHCRGRVRPVLPGSGHPSCSLFTLLLSGRLFKSIWTRISRFRDSFYLHAIRLLTCWETLCHTFATLRLFKTC